MKITVCQRDVNRIVIGDVIAIGVCPPSRVVVIGVKDGEITYRKMGAIGYWFWRAKVVAARVFRRVCSWVRGRL